MVVDFSGFKRNLYGLDCVPYYKGSDLHTLMQTFYRNLRSTHLGIFAIILGVGVWALSARAMQDPDPSDLFNKVTLGVQAVLVVLGFFAASFAFRFMVNRVRAKKLIGRKLDHYLLACLVKYIILALPCLFGPLMFYITGNILLIMMTSIIALVYYLNKPTVDKVIGDTQLTTSDLELLQKVTGN